MDSYGNGGIMALFAIFGALMLVFVIFGIILYVLMALGLYKLASNRGIENPWLAWIPVANLYIFAKLIGTLSIGGWKVPNLEIFLPAGVVAVLIISWIPVIGQLCGIAFAVLYFFALHKLYKIYRPQSAVLWLVLSIIFSFLGPIFIFVMRNDSLVPEEQ